MGIPCIVERKSAGSIRKAVLLALALCSLATVSPLARAQAWARAELVRSEPGSARAAVVARDRSAARTESAGSGAGPATSAGSTLLDRYSQGDKDNCGAVALTKLVFALYGEEPTTGPFSHLNQNDGLVAVELADAVRRTLRRRSLARLRTRAAWKRVQARWTGQTWCTP